MRKINAAANWLIRLLKGLVIGTGFILPGVSGGALAAIFGLYERIISFLAHITKNFKKNILYFLPVGIGMLLGIVVLAYPLGFFLQKYPDQTIWCFIGCIAGTFPSLWKQSGKKGREKKHVAILFISFAIAFIVLQFGIKAINFNMSLNFVTWMLAGAIIALGILIPGLSPSNFLLFMGMYQPMIEAFKTINFKVLMPLAIGGVICVLAFAKLIDMLFIKAYSGLFHVIIGVVAASTVVIIPLNINYISLAGLACVLLFGAGLLLGLWMANLEEKYIE